MNRVTTENLREALAVAFERGLQEGDAEKFEETLTAKAMVYADSRFQDFGALDGEIERLIAAVPDMQSLKPVDKYVLAGLAIRGIVYSNGREGALD